MCGRVLNTEPIVSGTNVIVKVDLNMLVKNKQEIKTNLCCLWLLLYSSPHILPHALCTWPSPMELLHKAALTCAASFSHVIVHSEGFLTIKFSFV